MNDLIDIAIDDSSARMAWGRMQGAVGVLAARLAEFLRGRFSGNEAVIASAIKFLDHESKSRTPDGDHADATQGDDELVLPLDRLIYGFRLSACEVDLLVLSGLAEEHEGYADIFKSLHPQGRPRPTAGLAAQLLTSSHEERHVLRGILETGAAMRFGVLRLEEEGPLYTRDLVAAPALWSVLQGIDAWPDELAPLEAVAATHGLDDWMSQKPTLQAQRALRQGMRCTVVVSADEEEVAFQRAIALARTAGVHAVYLGRPEEPSRDFERLVEVHALARGAVPVVRVAWVDGPRRLSSPGFADYPATVVLCARGGVDTKSCCAADDQYRLGAPERDGRARDVAQDPARPVRVCGAARGAFSNRAFPWLAGGRRPRSSGRQ